MNRVMMINGSASPLKCGVGYYGEMLVPELSKDNTVQVLTTKGLGLDIEGASKTYHAKNWKIWQIPKIASIIKKSKPNVAHIQYPAKGYKRELGINLLPLWIRIFERKLPILVTLHEYHESAGLGKIRNLITVFFANRIIVSNKLDMDSLPKILRKKVFVIPIGSTMKSYPRNRKAYESFMNTAGLSANKPTLAYFGFVNPNKGLETLINASKDINAQILVLAALDSDNPYHKKIDTLVESAKKQGAKLYVAGFLENELVSQIMQECLFFVLPQPLPLTAKSSTAIVATQNGLPVVSKASDEAKYNYPYINDANSVLLDEMNEKTLITACNELVQNPEKLKNLKSENAKLKSQFAWESIAIKHTEVYETLKSID